MKNMRRRFYTAEQRWLAAMGRFFLTFLNLEASYSTTKMALEIGKPQLEKKWKEGVRKAATEYPLGQGTRKNNPLFANKQLSNGFALAMGSRSLRLATQTLDAATLVFAHTLLDEAISEACWISFASNAQDWYPFIGDRKVTIGQLRTQALDENLKEVISDSIKQMERESMKKRLERIHAICIPKLKGAPSPTSWIKFDALERFDDLRHRVVHEAGFTRSIKSVEDEIFFAKQAGLNVLMLLRQAYDLTTEKGFPSANNRDALRLCAIVRREFPEFWEFFSNNADALTDNETGNELREILKEMRNSQPTSENH